MNNVFTKVRGSALILPVPPVMEQKEAIERFKQVVAAILDAWHKYDELFKTLRQHPEIVGEPRFAMVRNVRELERTMKDLFEEKRLVLSQLPGEALIL